MMATIKGCTPVNLWNDKLKYDLFSGSLFGLPVQEAILHNQLVFGFHISNGSLFVKYLQQGCFKSLTRGFLMFDYLIEDRVLSLFKAPISNVGGC